MKNFAVMFLLVLFSILGIARGSEISEEYDREQFGSGFVAVEGGQWRLLGDSGDLLKHPVMFYVTTGFSLGYALKDGAEVSGPWRIGPKIGIGFGSLRGQETDYFYDLLLKIRYTFGSPEHTLRPYVDVGPGVLNYYQTAGEVEGGLGVDYYFTKGSVGINAQYKELFGAGILTRGIVLLATLAYQF